MNKITFTLLLMLVCASMYGQVYLEDFDEVSEDQLYYDAGYTGAIADGEWTITGDGSAEAYKIFSYKPVDAGGTATTLDITENNKIYVRAKASNNGTQLRLDMHDVNGFVTNAMSTAKFLIADYTVYEFDFTGKLNDGGFGGPCSSDNAPCPVDGTMISEFQFFANPDNGAFAGSIVIDFVSVGTEPVVGPMSDIFQDHFDDTTSLRFIGRDTAGYTNTVEESQWRIKGDGTNGMWDPVSMLTYNPATLEEVDVSVAAGGDKVYLRMRSTVPGTSIRIDLQDINSFATTAGSITQVISDEFETYEFNYAGSYQDLAYGGTGCTEGGPACDVDAERITNMIIFINPGVEAFAGEVHIEYISVGTPLEIVDGNDVLAYADHFSEDDQTYISTSGTYELGISESLLSITGSGEDVPFSNVGYTPHDENGAVIVNATGNNKVFIKARSTVDNTLLRVDLIDSSNYATTSPSLTRVLNQDFQVLELNFSNQYFDAGYGGTACEEGTGPCAVDGSIIQTMLLYPNPADGGFAGTIEIDYISFGLPLGDDVEVFKYVDEFSDGDVSKFGETGGIVLAETDGILTLTGDGTSGAFGAVSYIPHDAETSEDYVLDITSTNKVYIKAKSTTPVSLRMDVEDVDGYASTSPGVVVGITDEYQILEFNYEGNYNDGGFSGTACSSDNAPCPVDGAQVKQFIFYVDPGTGMFDGVISVDWLSTVDPFEQDTVDLGPLGVDDYQDELNTLDTNFFADNTGLTLSGADGLVTITGDGSQSEYGPIGYATNDGTDTIIVNAANNDNKLFVRMKSSSDTTMMRIDLVDNLNYHTTLAGLTQQLSTEFAVYEYDFSGNLSDGAFSGTACEVGPCSVDAQRIEQLQFYIDPAEGAFTGTLEIDWIAFGNPLTSSIVDTEVADQAKVYPNPASGEFYLLLDAKIVGNMKATLIDIAGRVVSQQDLGRTNLGENSKVVNVGDINQGMYFLQVSIDNKAAFNQKIFIK